MSTLPKRPTSAYEPPMEAEPAPSTLSAYARATEAVRDAHTLSREYELAPDVKHALNVLLSCFEAEPEDTLLESDYRYLAAKSDRVGDTVRANFHPVNPAVLGHLAASRDALKVGVANMLARV